MKLSVELTEKEVEVFFNMLAMSASEPSDVDDKEHQEIQRKFTKSRDENINIRKK